MTAPVKGPASYFPSIEARYGRPIQHWLALVEAHPEERHSEAVARLKTGHGLGHGHANAIVAYARAQAQTPAQTLARGQKGT